jgi:hypothetical protein
MRLAIMPLLLMVIPCANAKTFPPRDECAGVRDFQPVWQRLLTAVKARDSKALLALAADDIGWSQGDNAGKAGFAQFWRLQDGKKSRIWTELDRIVTLGCAVDGRDLTIPYLASRLPEGADHNIYLVVTGTNVNLRSGPSATANVITQLSWEVVVEVEAPRIKVAEGWSRIQTGQGLTGYISTPYLRSADDYKAVFQHYKGQWLITAFVEGE